MKRTLGGDRLGGGKKMQVEMHNYGRSTHNLSETFRSSMAAGTLVPFLKKVALPGDTFDINMNAEVMTLPTVGPLFGTYQLQCDVFLCPIRLYEAKLHMNMLGIGMKMDTVDLPQIQLKGLTPNTRFGNIDNLQVNPSSIIKYLGISGMGQNPETDDIITRNFHATALLAYWDIYKNYYANKMEEIGAMIHKEPVPTGTTITSANWYNGEPSPQAIDVTAPYTTAAVTLKNNNMRLEIVLNDLTNAVPLENIQIGTDDDIEPTWRPLTYFFEDWQYDLANNRLIGYNYIWRYIGENENLILNGIRYQATDTESEGYPTITTFPLENIDNMKLEILRAVAPIIITPTFPGYAPYSNILSGEDLTTPPNSKFAITYTQEGLGLRTYKSDLFNNWLNTEWVDDLTDPNSIASKTRINTAMGGGFTMDQLNMSQKLYNMLNRIAASGGTYDDWLDAVYTEDRTRSAENPMYMGGLIQDVVFQEVISTAQTTEAPLGQLAGRGRNGNKRKGGTMVIKVDEPSYIIGIVSLVPNIDYSQGNEWDMSLRTMDDFHKPALDEIGFQDLITDQMAWWDTQVDTADELTYRSAGKQPAWINYMTSYNKVYGTFADVNQQMFMVLARRYEMGYDSVPGGEYRTINDLTTYVDPSKFNHIFADTRLDAQNFWVQIGVGIEARRKMSAKIIPNL